MIGIAVRLWEIITRLSKVRSNSIPRGQDVQGYHCPHSQRIPHNIIPNNTRGLAMDNVVKHVLGNWSVVAATITALGLLVAVVRYKIPELAKKVAEMEVANKSQPNKEDIAIDMAKLVKEFQAHCKANQATCQRSVNIELVRVQREIDKKLDTIAAITNAQAVVIARVDERIGALYRNHDHSFIPPESVLNVK